MLCSNRRNCRCCCKNERDSSTFFPIVDSALSTYARPQVYCVGARRCCHPATGEHRVRMHCWNYRSSSHRCDCSKPPWPSYWKERQEPFPMSLQKLYSNRRSCRCCCKNERDSSTFFPIVDSVLSTYA